MAKKKQVIETTDNICIKYYKLHIDFDGTRHGYSSGEETIRGVKSRREVAEHIKQSGRKPTYILLFNMDKDWAEYFNVSNDFNLSVRRNLNW